LTLMTSSWANAIKTAWRGWWVMGGSAGAPRRLEARWVSRLLALGIACRRRHTDGSGAVPDGG
jgi:hypothetical protein